MNKRHLHHIWTKIRPVKTSYLLGLFIVSGVICVFALRSNNLTMIKLRNNVYTADQENGNVEGALEKLRAYVGAHMNTNLDTGNGSVYPPIQLKYTYERLEAAQQTDSANNSQLYTDAENYCQQLDSSAFSGRSRVPCVENYVATHGVSAQAIPPDLYEFDFVSAWWSPDLAGWSLVATIVIGIAAALRFIAGIWFKKVLKH